MLGGQPILVLKEGTQRESGKNAQNKNIAAARAIADAVRSTLGPKGMDKMLVDSMGDVVITNDGVTILKEIDVFGELIAQVNGVSRLHGEVSRNIFQSLFPRWPTTIAVPIGRKIRS